MSVEIERVAVSVDIGCRSSCGQSRTGFGRRAPEREQERGRPTDATDRGDEEPGRTHRSSQMSNASSSDHSPGPERAERDADDAERHHVLPALPRPEDEESVATVIDRPGHPHHADDAGRGERREQPEQEEDPAADLGDAGEPGLQFAGRIPIERTTSPFRRSCGRTWLMPCASITAPPHSAAGGARSRSRRRRSSAQSVSWVHAVRGSGPRRIRWPHGQGATVRFGTRRRGYRNRRARRRYGGRSARRSRTPLRPKIQRRAGDLPHLGERRDRASRHRRSAHTTRWRSCHRCQEDERDHDRDPRTPDPAR